MGDRVETTTDAMAANADADADAGADKAKPGGEELPLVTFALFAYNQEKYIREAIEGAFSQTYEPLEIILSDDCSRDDTHRIMCEMAAGYRGHHRVLAHLITPSGSSRKSSTGRSADDTPAISAITRTS